MANRLATATSPYLLQHANNPVDWREWGEEAFAEARRRDVPVLLSVGYAACHWCHVMAHESFEDAGVAAALNDRFVAVKVDREERPDVDAAYMSATTALTGQGGWPMTCFLTPDGDPFYCGTYYPRDHFLALLDGVAEAWAERRDAVEQQGAAITEAVTQASTRLTPDRLDDDALAAAVRALAHEADPVHGGFGRAPKFPPSMTLEHLLRHHARTGDPEALRIVERACEAMARGGIYDQLAGGFARYSVDAAWVVPHFEKMLYDNAQLLRAYLHLYRATGSPLAARVARETAGFLLTDLRTPEGGFASALDADTDGVEGLTYVWTPAQLVEVLGPDDGARAAELLSVTPEGTFEEGASTLQLPEDPDHGWWAGVRARLAEARSARPQPARDDKVVTAWNGLAIAALAEAGVLLGAPGLIAAARECAELVLGRHLVDGRLRRASRGGVVGSAPGVAADHGDLAEGLLALHQATGETRWLDAAGGLLDTAQSRFGDGAGGFFDVADDAERLVSRPKDATDAAEPAGQSALAGALCAYAALTGSPRHRAAAETAVAAAGSLARQAPRFAGWTLAVAEALATGPLQVAVVGPDDDARAALERVARGATSAGLVVAVGEPDAPGVPLLADRPLVDGQAAAYVCRGFVCDRPVTTAEELTAALGA
ncbi:thioredoxin domain-containing protein [Promicromonospora sp. NFX87]|uniref:thioredoxin domain-containing protein n=1 Tax=Promicromonospora sp. NFX87 TaxID=3402691 RepID=UPI003AFB0AAB